MMNRRKRNVILILLLLNLCFIWGNSLLPPHASNAIGDKVTEIIRSVFAVQQEKQEKPDTWWTGAHVRKLTHATEFATLVALSTAYVLAHGKRLRDCWPFLLLCGVLTALTDETIQLFTGRTSAVEDVWIDSGGFAAGMVVIVYLLIRAGRKRE